MKRYLTFFVLLCIVGTAYGAHFNYYAGGLRAYYEVYTQDGGYFDGPYSGKMDHTTYAWAGGSAAVPPPPQIPQASSEARSDILRDDRGNSIRIQSYSFAKGLAATTACYTRAETYARTQDYLDNYGIFYQIKPDSGEQIGDDVMVYYNDMVNIPATGTTYVRIGGPGTMDHLAITRGQLPPVPTEPDRENEVLSFPDITLFNSGDDWFSGVHPFPAKIGDIIGIFAQNYTWIADWGPLIGEVPYSRHTMILTVRAVLAGDSDYDGDVDFYDLAKLANNWLEGVGIEPLPDTTPPTPDPVQWASGPKEDPRGGTFDYWAVMTAKVALDPSGGVQYKFECTTAGGFSSNWQGSPYYEVQVGRTEQYHRFRVKARDIHGNESLNWSIELPTLP